MFRGETRRRKIEFRGILEIARKEFEKERKVERVLRRSRRGKKKEGKSEEFDRSTLNRRAPFPLGHPRGTDVSAFAAETHRYAHTLTTHTHTHTLAGQKLTGVTRFASTSDLIPSTYTTYT